MSESTHPDCIVCGAAAWKERPEETRILRLRQGFSLVQCAKCGLRRLNPVPSQQELRSFYDDDSLIQEYQQNHNISYVLGSDQAAPCVNERLKKISGERGGAGRILDIGAAQGAFLQAAKQKGWSVLGLELSPEGAAAGQRLGIEIRQQTLHEAALPDQSFDAVHMSHVLEHLPDPAGTMQEIRRILKPGGILVIEVPNEFDDLFYTLQARLLGRPRPDNAVPSPHVYFFTPETLRRLMAKSGFDIFHFQTPRRNANPDSRYPLGSLIRKSIFRIEQVMRRGPAIEVYAIRQP